MTDYSSKIKEIINSKKEKGFEYGKSIKYLSFRNSITTKEEFEQELSSLLHLKFTDKQEVKGETRYTLYFVYNKSCGRAYVITFREKIRVITIFPLGKKTLRKCKERVFK